jgi:hypothetical protein
MPDTKTLSEARDHAIAVLQDAVAADRIELDGFEERMDAVMAARDHAAIHAAVADLPGAAVALPEVRSSFELAVEPIQMTAIFGGSQRRVAGIVPRELRARAVFGGVDLDLRGARFQPGTTTIHCTAVFGGVDIKLPPDVCVDVGGTGIFGGFDEARGDGESHPHPEVVVRIVGRAIFGGVSARRRKADIAR